MAVDLVGDLDAAVAEPAGDLGEAMHARRHPRCQAPPALSPAIHDSPRTPRASTRQSDDGTRNPPLRESRHSAAGGTPARDVEPAQATAKAFALHPAYPAKDSARPRRGCFPAPAATARRRTDTGSWDRTFVPRDGNQTVRHHADPEGNRP